MLMKIFNGSLLIHLSLIFFLPLNGMKKESVTVPKVESSAEVIHISFKLNETDVKELKKKIEVIKKTKK